MNTHFPINPNFIACLMSFVFNKFVWNLIISRNFSSIHLPHYCGSYIAWNCYYNVNFPKVHHSIRRKYLHSYIPSVNALAKHICCGEIVSGRPIKRNYDGSILVDIGLPEKMLVSENSMIYMNDFERKKFINKMNNLSNGCVEELTEEDAIKKTLESARKLPYRKNKTYMKPKYYYPNDFKRRKKLKSNVITYDLGIGGEIQPRRMSIPKKYMNNEVDNNMEFLVTHIDPYTNYLRGEFFSVGIVESKRRIYLGLMMESTSHSSGFMSYTAVIREKSDKLLKIELQDSKFTHLSGLNAFTLSNESDKVGDIIKVYLGAVDSVLEHLYAFRTQISHSLIQKNTLKSIYDEIIKYYIRSGSWFKGEVKDVTDDWLRLRILGQGEHKIYAYLFKQDLPYTHFEDIIYETFIRSNNPNDYFRTKSTESGIGKANYCYHYDNTIYVRIDGYALPDKNMEPYPLKTLNNETIIVYLSCRNVYKPTGIMEVIFKKMVTQTIDGLDLKVGLSYPCLVVGYNDGYIYFAINYKFKENFTLDDDYVIGVLESDRSMNKSLVGSFVHAHISGVCNYRIFGQFVKVYNNRTWGNSYHFDTLSNWLKQSKDDSLNNVNNLNILMMDITPVPNPDSPQISKYLYLQPFYTEWPIFDYGGINSPLLDTYTPRLKRQQQYALLDRISLHDNPNLRSDTPPKDLGTLYISNAYHSEDMIAEPIYYTNNEDMRDFFLRNTLDRPLYSLYRSMLKSTNIDTEKAICEFFVYSEGVTFWDMLHKLTDMESRRSINLKEAMHFEKSIKQLLHSYHHLNIDVIYENYDKSDLMFATIAPKSHNYGKFFQTYEIANYLNHIRSDFLMDENIRGSIYRALTLLIEPKNLLMSKLRAKHSKIPNDVFFYLKKSHLYDSFFGIDDISLLSGENGSSGLRIFEGEQDEGDISPMMPFPNIAREPSLFGHQLQRYGLCRVRRLYNNMLSFYKNRLYKHICPVGLDDEGDNYANYIDETDFDDPEISSQFQTFKENDCQNRTSRITFKEWKYLNNYPKYASQEDVIDFLRESKKYNPVHGLRLPIL